MDISANVIDDIDMYLGQESTFCGFRATRGFSAPPQWLNKNNNLMTWKYILTIFAVMFKRS